LHHVDGKQPELECEFIPLSVTASTWVSSSKTANTTTTTSSSSSGCSMSPPDDFDHSTIHTPSDRTTDSLNTPYSSGHGLTGSSTSTNCHRQVGAPLKILILGLVLVKKFLSINRNRLTVNLWNNFRLIKNIILTPLAD